MCINYKTDAERQEEELQHKEKRVPEHCDGQRRERQNLKSQRLKFSTTEEKGESSNSGNPTQSTQSRTPADLDLRQAY